MKKLIALLLASVLALSLAACGEKNLLHCDGCGKEVDADPKMDESWIIFCEECGEPTIDMG